MLAMWWRWGWLGLALVLGRAASAAAPDPVVGQWIWCDADRRHFAAARIGDPALVPAVLVSTITIEDGRVVQHLGSSPAYVEAPAVALVVRFDDGFHAFWSLADGGAARAAVGAKLAWIVERARAMGVPVAEVQLDYDCPIRRLGAWADLLRELVSGPLREHPVWITSLPSHMDVPGYGDWFRPVVAGHILQVFDVGPSPTVAEAPRLAARARAQRMPFRLGIGAFERVRGPTRAAVTDHGGWADAVPAFARDATFRGVWIFPGGMPWGHARRQ